MQWRGVQLIKKEGPEAFFVSSSSARISCLIGRRPQGLSFLKMLPVWSCEVAVYLVMYVLFPSEDAFWLTETLLTLLSFWPVRGCFLAGWAQSVQGSEVIQWLCWKTVNQMKSSACQSSPSISHHFSGPVCVWLNQVLMFLGPGVSLREAGRICLSSSSHNFAMWLKTLGENVSDRKQRLGLMAWSRGFCGPA